MTAATEARTASYKGRAYRLMFVGETKYGRRAHLAFMDGSKDFWVDAALVTTASAATSGARTRTAPGRCRGCRGPIVDASHHRAIGGYCGQCAFDEFDC